MSSKIIRIRELSVEVRYLHANRRDVRRKALATNWSTSGINGVESDSNKCIWSESVWSSFWWCVILFMICLESWIRWRRRSRSGNDSSDMTRCSTTERTSRMPDGYEGVGCNATKKQSWFKKNSSNAMSFILRTFQLLLNLFPNMLKFPIPWLIKVHLFLALLNIRFFQTVFILKEAH